MTGKIRVDGQPKGEDAGSQQFLVDFKRGRWSPSTQTCYGINWRDFCRYCAEQAAESLPAAPETIAGYLLAREPTHSTSSLSQRLAAIVAAHGLAGFDVPVKKTVIRDAWAEIRRRKGSAKVPKREIAFDDIRKIMRGVPLDRVQDRAVMLVGFKSAMRRSELVALNVDDLVFTPKHLSITIRRSKTDKDGKGEVVAVLRGGEFCAVNALERWLSIGQISNGPVFRIGDHRMPPRAVATITKKWAKNAGYNPREIGAHSLRRGCITTMHRAGVDAKSGMALSRHKTISIYLGYVADHAAAENPAIKALAI